MLLAGMASVQAVTLSDDFEDGDDSGWSRQSGAWAIETENNNKYYSVAAVSWDSEATSYLHGTVTRGNTIVEVDFSSIDTPGYSKNAFIVFDYHNDGDFKYAGARVGAGVWVIGYCNSSGCVDVATFDPSQNDDIEPGSWYRMKVQISCNTVKLYVGESPDVTVQFEFDSIDSGYIGLSTTGGNTHFDNFSLQYDALDFYVDAVNGNDGGDGSLLSPWQTISKVSGTTFMQGDNIHFRCGDTWHEQLNVPSSGTELNPITFTSYGTDENPCDESNKPIIDAAQEITGWQLHSGNIYVADVSGAVKQLFVDGQYMKLAEYRSDTNGGYFIIDEDSGNMSLKDSDLIIPYNQTIAGAGIHVRTVNWRIEDRIVTGYNSNVLSWDTATEFPIKKDYGYYLDNKLWMLNSAGEWYYDGTNGRLYVWPADGSDPNTHNIEASVYDYGVIINGKNNVVIDGLQIKNAALDGIAVWNSTGYLVSNANISDSGRTGIYTYKSPSGVIQYCDVDRSVNQGIWLHLSDNGKILGTRIENTGTAGSPKNSLAAITAYDSANTKITGNNILKSGYHGITVKQGSEVRNNVIEESCLVLNDCSGIYTAAKGSDITSATQIIGNIILDSIGNIDGTPPYNHLSAKGIYLDNNADTAVVEDNTIVNASYGGIALHGARNMSIADNTLYGNANCQIVLYTCIQDMCDLYGMGNNIITDNIFFPLDSNDHVRLQGDYGNVYLGNFDLNTYSIIYSDYIVNEQIKEYPSDPYYYTTRYTLDEWQQQKSMETGASLFYPFDISSDHVLSIDPDNLIANSTFDNPPSYEEWWFSSTGPGASKVHEPNCNITGGCLKFTSDSDAVSNLLYSNEFDLVKGRTYMLEFKAKASEGQPIDDVKFLVRKAEGYWESVGLEKTVDVQTTWRNYRYIFTATQTLSNARVYFYVPPGAVTLFIDEVVVSEVTTESSNDFSDILINKTSAPQSFMCSYDESRCSQYIELDGSSVDWSERVAPFSSKIIVWTGYPYIDTDHDGVLDVEDNCPNQENPFQTDADDDGFGAACDCNDSDASINPGASDSTCDGIDENCSGTADEGYVPTQTTCGVGACESTGQLICVSGQLQDTCIPGTPQTEICNWIDDDCDGYTDEGLNYVCP